MSNIKLYLIKYEIPALNRLGIATVTASSPKQAQDYLQAQGKYNGYKYDMNYPIIVHTTDTWTAAAIISEIDNPVGEKGDRGPQGPIGPQGPKGDPGESMTWEKMDPEDKMAFKEDAVADVESEIKTKYYPKMSVGMADNLVGRGDVQDAHINFRPSAGVTNITDGVARIERIKGNSVVYNQLRFDNIKSNVYTFQVSQSGNRIEFSDAYADYAKIPIGDTAVLNHYYYIACDVIENDFGLAVITHNAGAMSVNALKLSNNGRNETIVQCKTLNATDNSWKFMIHDAELSGKHTIVDNLVIIDLTKEFDDDIANEIATASDPIARYNELKPMNIEDEYTYNNGEIISVKVDALKSVGDNAYNSKKVIARVMGGHAYEITANEGAKLEVSFYADGEDDNEEREIAPNSDGEYIFPANGYCYVNGAPHEEVCVCVKHSYPKHSKYYEENTKDLSWIADIEYKGAPLFPNGMRSAGSAYDEIRYNRTTKKWEAVKRIGEIALESIPKAKWEIKIQNNYSTFRASYLTLGAKYIASGTNAVCNKYSRGHEKIYTDGIDKTFELNHQYYGSLAVKDALSIRDTAYTDIDSFVQSLVDDNVTLYYELAEPIVVTLDYPTVETNMDYLVWDFGTEEAIASVPSAPFRADINYEPNAVDDLRWAVSEIRNLRAELAQLKSAQVNETSLIE